MPRGRPKINGSELSLTEIKSTTDDALMFPFKLMSVVFSRENNGCVQNILKFVTV